MYNLDLLLKKAQLNDNKLNMDDIDKLQIDETEYDKLLKSLSEKGITIEFDEELTNEDIDNIISSSKSNERYTTDDVKKYLTEIGKHPVLTREEAFEVFQKYKNGDLKAKEKLINCNLKLVASIAKRYINRANNFNGFFSYLDIIQEGNLGLLKAIEKFDETKGYKFSTYATWWIKQTINREMFEKERTIRIPIHRYKELKKINNYIEKYAKQFGHEPSYKECADALEMNADQVEKLLLLNEAVISLNTTIGEEEENELMDFVPSAINVGDSVTNEIVTEIIINGMKEVLTEKEYTVLILRYGAFNGRSYTLEEVGEKFNVTRERIRQIESKALRKVRRKFRKYTEDDIPYVR